MPTKLNIPETNSAHVRNQRQELAYLFTIRDPNLLSVPEDRYPEEHDTLRRILSGRRVSDYEVEFAFGVVEGLRRTRRLFVR